MPPIAPLNVVLPFVMLRSLEPNVTVPLPDKVTIDAPDVVPEILSVPLACTFDDDAIAPDPDKAIVPLVIVVTPV